ncbi:MAG TPA: lipid-A-disaccharide synthase [Candidatus Paceibacterota bacterium]|nr:lipid-A-disaccharide synthase [Verrucomicrobiota bacterium]HSA13048.1 lipid-A-disaccharide synthase [Candidatus Paceibacterota bacterium]
MRPNTFMLIAGEASGDMLAAELVRAIRQESAEAGAVPTTDYQPLHTSLAPRFFGAGGPQMAAAGVELALDMTEHSIIGLTEALKHYFKFRRLFRHLFQLAVERQPDAIICVDFSGFNRRFARAIRNYHRTRRDWFHVWHPRLIQYVSPQVWASREGRAQQIARDYDLVLSIFPFEQQWYAKRVPQLRVEFVGHPIVDRYGQGQVARSEIRTGKGTLTVLLLPGSRPGELQRHLPVMIDALALIQAKLVGLRARMVLPNEALMQKARALRLSPDLSLQVGGLPEALAAADVAIASTGTVTTECAFFGVPTVALYKTSWSTWQIAKRIVKVKYAAMPNLLANEAVFPEFIQNAATPDNIALAAADLLRDAPRRARVKARLAEIVTSLGPPGAPRRAARAILKTF